MRLAIILLSLLLFCPVQADTIYQLESDFTVAVPTGWKVERKGTRTFVQSADGLAVVSFDKVKTGPDAPGFEQIWANYMKNLNEIVPNPKLDGQPKSGGRQGAKINAVTGTGTSDEGRGVSWSLVLMEGRVGRLVSLALVDNRGKKHVDAVIKMVASVQPSWAQPVK